MRRRFGTRLDMRIPREAAIGVLLLTAVLLLFQGPLETQADIPAGVQGEAILQASEPESSAAVAEKEAVSRGIADFWPARQEPLHTHGPVEAAGGAGITLSVYVEEIKKIEKMDLEDYVYHVVAAEVPASYQVEAIRAQAVAARSYALYGAEHGGCSKGADICTSSGHCQAFADEAELKERWGADYTQYSTKIRQAVESTRGEVITYKGEVIHALFHAISGGRTEDALAVFNMNLPYLKSVESKGEENAPRYKQTFRFSRKEFVETVNERYSKAKLSQAKLSGQVEILEKLSSGQVGKIRLGGAVITGREFRKITGIASANFTIGYTENEIYIYTVGFGHGVGMSQAGANAMALKGSGYEGILSHYYVGTTLQKYAEA